MDYNEHELLQQIDRVFTHHSDFTIRLNPGLTAASAGRADRGQGAIPAQYVKGRFDLHGPKRGLFLQMKDREGTTFTFKIPSTNLNPIYPPDPEEPGSLELQIAVDLSTLVDEYICNYTIDELDGAVLTVDGRLTRE